MVDSNPPSAASLEPAHRVLHGGPGLEEALPAMASPAHFQLTSPRPLPPTRGGGESRHLYRHLGQGLAPLPRLHIAESVAGLSDPLEHKQGPGLGQGWAEAKVIRPSCPQSSQLGGQSRRASWSCWPAPLV